MTKRLIVNADDYGRTAGVSAGIREAHQCGIVTSTTAMMNMPGVEAALRLAQRDCPSLGLGVHLVLTSGRPLLPPKQISTLTGEDGRFPGLDEFMARLPFVSVTEATLEWRAQIELFVATVGRSPDHLDSHHHTSYLLPPLFRAMLELAVEYGCAIRSPITDGQAIFDGLPDNIAAQFRQFTTDLIASFAPPHPNHFEAAFYDETATTANLLNILAALPDGITELMCHPGYADEELLAGSSYNRQREIELASLTDPAALEAVKQQGIELISFSALALIP